MAPITQLSLLALATTVLAVPHAEPFRRHAHVHQRAAPPAYGESSAPPAYGSSSEASPEASSAAPPAYGSSSAAPPAYGSSSEADPASSSGIPAYGSSSLPAYGSGSSAGPASSSAVPSYSYSFSGVASSGYAGPTAGYAHPTGSSAWGSTGYAHPTGSYSGPVSYSTCTETSTLIYRSTTEYSTYVVTHTLYPGASSTGAVGGSASGYPADAPSAPASEPAGYPSNPSDGPSGAPVSPVTSGVAEGSCVPDVTVTTTEKSTIYITAGASSPAPSEAAPSEPAATPTNTWKASWEPAPTPSEAPAPSTYEPAPTPSGAPAPTSEAPSPSSYAPAPSSPPASPGNSGYGGKRGLAYNDAGLTNMFAQSSNVGWAYNWESDNKGLDSGVPYIPTLWGTDSMWTSIWEANAQSAISGGAKYLFSFNEPDMPSQANLSPEAAAAAWKQYMEPFAGQVKLVAPGVTNGQSPGLGLEWLQSFLSACSDCTIDAIAQHWYWDSNDSAAFKEQLQKTIDTIGKPLWVNEFGAVGSDDEKATFLQDVMSWMDSNNDILGYAYFMVSDGLLCSGNGPSPYGSVYADYSG